MSQFSLFGAAAATPDPRGPRRRAARRRALGAHRRRARLSIVVADRWRADALAEEFARRGVAGDVVAAEDGWSVRTAFTAALMPHADRAGAAARTRGRRRASS